MLGDITAAGELYIVTGYTDMRKSIDGLCAIVEDQLHMDPRRSALYLFCGKRCDRVKPPIVLYHYTETRARYNAVDFLDGFSDGYLETDGYQGYNNLPESGAAPAGRIQEDTSLMRFQKESSMITAIRQYRESSSVQSFLSTSADHRTRSAHLSREKPIVLKKKNRYLMRSGTGLMNRSHVREAVSRQR